MTYSLWFQEFLTPQLSQQLTVKQVLYSGKTRYQQVSILDTHSFGRCLILDGKLQSAEVDEFIYHEALVHPAMVFHPNPRKVFIAGGGEGATLREVLSYKGLKKVVMVDIDKQVVELCQRFLSSWHQGAFSDPRGEVIFADAREYLSQNKEKYDVLILDLTDPVEGGPSYPLYTEKFYEMVKKHLNPQGLLVTQAGPCRLPTLETFTALYRRLKGVFSQVLPYQTEVPSFGGGWGFILAAERIKILTSKQVDRRISQRLGKQLSFYDGQIHQAMFTLPRYIRQRLVDSTGG